MRVRRHMYDLSASSSARANYHSLHHGDGCKFTFSLTIRGFHVYGKTWSPRIGQQLQTVKASFLLCIRHRIINLHLDRASS